jgi:hypothetical protein
MAGRRERTSTVRALERVHHDVAPWLICNIGGR